MRCGEERCKREIEEREVADLETDKRERERDFEE